MRKTYKALYETYRDESLILKAKQYARWTLPQLMVDPQLLVNENRAAIERDFQEIGALLVNNLSAKLAGLLFPSSRSFYKINTSDAIKQAAAAQGVTSAELQSGLSKAEMESSRQLLINGSYEQLIMALKHLIATGNVLLYRDTKNFKSHAFGLQMYGVRRDGRGNVMDIVLREYADFESLPNDVQAALRARNGGERGKYADSKEGERRVELYTRIKRERTQQDQVIFVVSQEADGIRVGQQGSYPEHLCPWQAVTWSLVTGENYGRGLVEDYAGGFAKLSDLSHSSTLYAIAMAKLVNLVAMGMGADVDELANAETGEYVQGQKDSVTTFEAGNDRKLTAIGAEIEATTGRLARAFMYRGNTRDAERVTAFELKQDALEAENTLGGVYSSLSAAMQVPLAHVLLTEVKPALLEGLITGAVRLDIVAGIPALGRQSDVQNLAAATQDAAAIAPTLTQLDSRVSGEKLMDVIYAGQSIDTQALFKDKEQLEQERLAQEQEAQGLQQIDQATTLADQSALAQQLQG